MVGWLGRGIADGWVLKYRPGVEGCNPAVLMRGLCLCGLGSGLMGSRCGKAGGRALSQSSWEKLKTRAFLETGGITEGWMEGKEGGVVTGTGKRAV